MKKKNNLFDGIGGFAPDADVLGLLPVSKEAVGDVKNRDIEYLKRLERCIQTLEKLIKLGESSEPVETTHENKYYDNKEENLIYVNQEEELGYYSRGNSEDANRDFNPYYEDRGTEGRHRKVQTRMLDVVYGRLVSYGGKKHTQTTGYICRTRAEGKGHEQDGSDKYMHYKQYATKQPCYYYNKRIRRLCFQQECAE